MATLTFDFSISVTYIFECLVAIAVANSEEKLRDETCISKMFHNLKRVKSPIFSRPAFETSLNLMRN